MQQRQITPEVVGKMLLKLEFKRHLPLWFHTCLVCLTWFWLTISLLTPIPAKRLFLNVEMSAVKLKFLEQLSDCGELFPCHFSSSGCITGTLTPLYTDVIILLSPQLQRVFSAVSEWASRWPHLHREATFTMTLSLNSSLTFSLHRSSMSCTVRLAAHFSCVRSARRGTRTRVSSPVAISCANPAYQAGR